MIHTREEKNVCVYTDTEKTTNTLLHLLHIHKNRIVSKNNTKLSSIPYQANFLCPVTPVTAHGSTDSGLKCKTQDTHKILRSRAGIRLLTGVEI